jgi:hypothetical protein
LFKESMKVDVKWSVFYSYAVIILSVIGVMGTIYALFYFNRKYKLKIQVQ